MTRAFAPVSAGNVIVGFDILGLALAPLGGDLWGDVVAVEDAPAGPPLRFSVQGPYRDSLPPEPESNLCHRLAERFLGSVASKGIPVRPLHVVLEKRLPVGSGLGSSASSAVAALTALNHHFGRPLDVEEMLALAGYGESLATGDAHYDNVAPALLGGLCLMRSLDPPRVQKLHWPEDWILAVVTPRAQIRTRDARAALPAQVPLGAAVAYARNLALFLEGLRAGDVALVRECLRDDLVEPARRGLLPGFEAAKWAALAAGALGCSFSGSGPTLIAPCALESAARGVESAMRGAFAHAGLECEGRLARADERGARILEPR